MSDFIYEDTFFVDRQMKALYPPNSPKRKMIYFFHFKTPEQPEYNPQSQGCLKGLEYPYSISYYTISTDLSPEGLIHLKKFIQSLSVLDPEFDQILFYTQITPPERSILSAFRAIVFGMYLQEQAYLKLLSDLREYITNCTAFIDYKVNKPLYISEEMLKENGIRVKKFLNLYTYDPAVSTQSVTTRSMRDDKLYYYKQFKKSDRLELVCNEWFMYFSFTAFGCVKSRVLQLSGTCYINSVINSIILSPVLRNIALHKMTQVNKAMYNKPLNLDVCDKKDKYYIFRLIFNLFCSSVPLRETVYKQDILIEYGKLHTDDPSGEGGDPFKTMTKILELIDPGYIQIDYKTSYNTMTGNTKMDEVVTKDGDGDFLIVEKGGMAYPHITHNGEKFVLQSSIISFNTGLGFAHAISGIICDDTYIIVDSNEGMINIDWRKLYNNQGIRNLFSEYFSYYKWDGSVYLYPIFVRESAIGKYGNISAQTLCAQL